MRTMTRHSFLSMLLISAYCLMTPAVAQAQGLPPPPAKDYFPEKWEEYTSEQGRFRIRFPGKPKEEYSPVGVNFFTYNGLLEYRVSYVDEPELSDTLDSAKQYLRESRSASQEIVKYSNERIIEEKEVTFDGYPGLFTYVESGKAWIRTQEIVVGKRVFTIIVEGRKGQANELEGKDNFEKVAMGFINSFKPIPSSAKPNEALQLAR